MADEMELIIDLLNELVAEVDIGEDRVNYISSELERIYAKPEFRHSYAELSSEMGRLKPDQRDMLCLYLDEMLNALSKKLGETQQTTVRFGKLCDHVNLESLRIARIERVEFIGEQSTRDLTEAGNDLVNTRSIVDSLREDVRGFHSQSITILGIFSGLVITFATVTQLVTAGIVNITEVSAYKVTLFLCVSFLLLFNLVFFLMYAVSKIAGKSIAARCEKRNCSVCGQCSWAIKKLWRKYPFFLAGNVVAALVCVAIYYINYTALLAA